MDELAVYSSSVVAVVFLTASLAKAVSRDSFVDALQSFRWLPRRVIAPLSIVVIITEGLLSILLLVPITRIPASIASLILLTIFSGAMVHSLVTGNRAGCGCFGGSNADKISSINLIRNAFLLLACLTTILEPPSTSRWVSVPVLLSSITTASVLVLLDDALSLFRRYWLTPEMVRR